MKERKHRLRKRAVLLTVLLTVAASFVHAQEEEKYTGMGIYATIDTSVDTFKITDYRFAHPDIRGQDAQDHTSFIFPTDTPNFWNDSYLILGYTGKNFGGNFRVRDQPDVKVWARFGFFQVSLGNDLKSIYADPLGADPELRIYTGEDSSGEAKWNEFVNPDNITDSQGLLLEGFFDKATIALASGYFKPSVKWLRLQGTNNYNDLETADFRYGARVGWDMGALGKVNASYMIKSNQWGSKFDNKKNSTDIAPIEADAMVFNHLFGLYGSLHLLPQLDLTIGYNGMLTDYLDEIYNKGTDAMEKVGYPLVFRNGFNINAAYRFDDLSLRIDHSLTFWKDKNYNLMETGEIKSNWKNHNLAYARQSDRFAEIDHFIMWNGIGMDYQLASNLIVGAYLRNLFSTYNLKGTTSAGADADYRLVRDEAQIKFTCTYRLSGRASISIGLSITDYIKFRSADLNAESSKWFIPNINMDPSKPKPDPVETFDNELTISIPLRFLMQL